MLRASVITDVPPQSPSCSLLVLLLLLMTMTVCPWTLVICLITDSRQARPCPAIGTASVTVLSCLILQQAEGTTRRLKDVDSTFGWGRIQDPFLGRQQVQRKSPGDVPCTPRASVSTPASGGIVLSKAAVIPQLCLRMEQHPSTSRGFLFL